MYTRQYVPCISYCMCCWPNTWRLNSLLAWYWDFIFRSSYIRLNYSSMTSSVFLLSSVHSFIPLLLHPSFLHSFILSFFLSDSYFRFLSLFFPLIHSYISFHSLVRSFFLSIPLSSLTFILPNRRVNEPIHQSMAPPLKLLIFQFRNQIQKLTHNVLCFIPSRD